MKHAVLHKRIRMRQYINSRTDWPSNDRGQLLRELEEISDEALLADRQGCWGKHWVRGYVSMGETCHYCGWTKERK